MHVIPTDRTPAALAARLGAFHDVVSRSVEYLNACDRAEAAGETEPPPPPGVVTGENLMALLESVYAATLLHYALDCALDAA